MRFPVKPPDFRETFRALGLGKLLGFAQHELPEGYPHWDQLRRFPLPRPNVAHAEWWAAIKWVRKSRSHPLPLTDKDGVEFAFSLPPALHQELHEIDCGPGSTTLAGTEPVLDSHVWDQYLVRSFVHEAIASSRLEGALSTRATAKEMIRTGRNPRDLSERMIVNNFMAMQRVQELANEKLSKELVFELHRTLTQGTLEKKDSAGRFRLPDEEVRILDENGEVFHAPPPAGQLGKRMQAMCDFANGVAPEYFVHPVVRAILLHFWLAYDHPFIDGNGRTARALFYWAMLHSKYSLFELLSISEVILRSPKRYYLAFLYSETDENDATYFVVHQMSVIRKAVQGLHACIALKNAELSQAERLLQHPTTAWNHRQIALMGYALRHPETAFTVEAHQRSNGIVYETARRDLLDLAEAGLLTKGKHGKAMVFRSALDLPERIKDRSWSRTGR
jgi:Fic family protein